MKIELCQQEEIVIIQVRGEGVLVKKGWKERETEQPKKASQMQKSK